MTPAMTPLDLAALRQVVDLYPELQGWGSPVVAKLLDLIDASTARAEAAEANHRKAERKANDLFDEGIRQKNRAIAAEALVVERDKELMQIQGPCRAPGCMLHRAHNGPCNIGSLARDGS